MPNVLFTRQPLSQKQRLYNATLLNLREQKASIQDQFAILLSLFMDTPYLHGEESIDVSDCSGSVCCVLNSIFNTDRRVTADTLYKVYFTRPFYQETNEITALFFVDETNKAVHVTGRIATNEYMNVSEVEKQGSRIRSLEELLFKYSDYKPVLRILQGGLWQ